MTSGSLWNYHRDTVNVSAKKIVANHRINDSRTTKSK